MDAVPEYASDSERCEELLEKATSGPDENISNLTEEEEEELRELWDSTGLTEKLGPYDHPERWVDQCVTNKCKVAAAPDQLEDDLPSLPPPPVMTWEEEELNHPGQLNFPALATIPTVAERAFLTLSREWLEAVESTPPNCPPPRTSDLQALACLLLAVEWGHKFTNVGTRQMEINQKTAAIRRDLPWMDELIWRLCRSNDNLASPQERDSVQVLTANLDHHNSGVRIWMMEIAWFAVPWMNPVEASVRLLKNLADTLRGVNMAAGLASRFFQQGAAFFEFARNFSPPALFADQYRGRLKEVEQRGIREMQASFWKTEAECRKEIARVCLGLRLPRHQ